MRFLLFALLLLAVAGVLLATQQENLAPASLYVPFTTLRLTGGLLWFLAGSVLTGVAIGYLGALPAQVAAANRARRAERDLATVETAQTEAAAARAQAARSRTAAAPAPVAQADAAETQRLADEVARRTADARRDTPPAY